MRFALSAFLFLALPAAAQSTAGSFQAAWAALPPPGEEHPAEGEESQMWNDRVDGLGRAWGEWLLHQPTAGRLNLPQFPLPDGQPQPAIHQLAALGPCILYGLDIPVPCGTHTILALVEEAAGGPKLRILDIRNSNPKTDALGFRENLQVRLTRGPRLLIASTPPWCSSCWSRLEFRVLEPGEEAGQPRLLTSFEDGVYRCTEGPVASIRVRGERIRVDYQTYGSPERLFRPRHRSLRLTPPATRH